MSSTDRPATDHRGDAHGPTTVDNAAGVWQGTSSTPSCLMWAGSQVVRRRHHTLVGATRPSRVLVIERPAAVRLATADAIAVAHRPASIPIAYDAAVAREVHVGQWAGLTGRAGDASRFPDDIAARLDRGDDVQARRSTVSRSATWRCRSPRRWPSCGHSMTGAETESRRLPRRRRAVPSSRTGCSGRLAAGPSLVAPRPRRGRRRAAPGSTTAGAGWRLSV